MSKNINQVYGANPITTVPDDALMYWGLSPFGSSNDAAIKKQDLFAQINGSAIFNGDTGSASGSTITIKTNSAALNSGSTINFSASGSTITLNVSDSLDNTIFGKNSGKLTGFTGSGNSIFAVGSFRSATSASYNAGNGASSGVNITSGTGNCWNGAVSFGHLTIGNYNVGAGYNVGDNYTSTESGNILFGGHKGVLGESFITRIGWIGNVASQLGCYIDGINIVNSSSLTTPKLVAIDSSTGQLANANYVFQKLFMQDPTFSTITGSVIPNTQLWIGGSAGGTPANGVYARSAYSINNNSGIGSYIGAMVDSTLGGIQGSLGYYVTGGSVDSSRMQWTASGGGTTVAVRFNPSAGNVDILETGVISTPGGNLAALATANSYTAQQNFANVSLTDASTITWNANTQQVASVLLTSGVGATRVLGAPSNLVNGGTYILRVKQSSTGSNALTYNAVYKWPGGSAPILSTANNAIDVLTFISDGTNMYGVAQFGFA